jgi:hypothetical protein
MTRRPWIPWSAARQGPIASHLPFERKRYYPGLLAADPMLDTAAVAAYNPRKFVGV